MNESSSDLVLLDVVSPGVGVVTLNKPDRLNAWSAAMSAAFFARLDEARANDDIRVVVVTGSGRGFCPGATGRVPMARSKWFMVGSVDTTAVSFIKACFIKKR